jgi:hypothetical protein
MLTGLQLTGLEELDRGEMASPALGDATVPAPVPHTVKAPPCILFPEKKGTIAPMVPSPHLTLPSHVTTHMSLCASVSASIVLWQYGQTRNQATLGGVENLDFIFTPAGSDVYLCLSTEQRIHKIFKR